ncbi:MAG: hypothetical protein ACKVTZ_10140 [Bacteroidia bacterium]
MLKAISILLLSFLAFRLPAQHSRNIVMIQAKAIQWLRFGCIPQTAQRIWKYNKIEHLCIENDSLLAVIGRKISDLTPTHLKHFKSVEEMDCRMVGIVYYDDSHIDTLTIASDNHIQIGEVVYRPSPEFVSLFVYLLPKEYIYGFRILNDKR